MDETPQSPENPGTPTSPPKTEHKTRRPHRKSRNGCTKCKERRVKCDELLPRCSRCQKTNLVCQYPKRQSGNYFAAEDYWMDTTDPSLLNFEVPSFSRRNDGASSPESSGSFYTLPDYLQHGRKIDSPLRSQVAQTLAPAEFELLRHYLEHTCRDMTVDPEDQYTIQIGIPNLACQSKPLMRSVLALAAICKCCDIINQPSVTCEERSQVIEYLAMADHYHMQSLREIQATLPDSKRYDHVLANAAMMGMYGSGSHRTRIWLTKTARFGDEALYDYMPKQLQWMSLWRAVDLAYMGMLNDNSSSPRPEEQHQSGSLSSLHHVPRQPHSPPEFMPSGSIFQPQSHYEYKITSRLERAKTPMVNHPLWTILAATASPALTKLRQTARNVALIHSSHSNLPGIGSFYGEPGGGTPPYSYTPDPALQSCFTALSILTNVMSETFPTNDSTMTPSQLTFEVDIDPARAGLLSEVSPWMRRFAASITALTPTKLPRRMIPAFIHKVPTSYLKLVTEMISFIHAGEQPPPASQNTAATSTTSDLDLNLDPNLNHINLDHPDLNTLNLDLDHDMHMGGGGGGSSTSIPSWGNATTPHHPSSCSSSSIMEPSPPDLPSLPHQLALEIFSHWLVLMILVDNVWWIGDLGAWELGRIVDFRKNILLQEKQQQQQTQQYSVWTAASQQQQAEEGGVVRGGSVEPTAEQDVWWPESMYEISRQFDKHRTEGGSSLGRDT
ncbi:hypothetical protein V8F06_007285 [Rhypophila decipiens]